jgi:hypothetical protein
MDNLATIARKALARLLVVLLASVTFSGCATLPNGHLWGEDATLRPGWERLRVSAIEAARDPWVWGPLLGAAAFQIDGLDRRTSDWAREHTPVFGSQRSAEDWSDDLREASVLAHYATVVATPGGDEPTEWFIAKAKGMLVNVAATSATSFVTGELKERADRERPNGLADESFPSGHTSSSAAHTRLASRNLRSIDMSDDARLLSNVGLTALMVGTSWARIEAGWHFPSDTLFSMALGHFIASFLNDGFLGLDDGTSAIAFAPAPDGAVVQWNWKF